MNDNKFYNKNILIININHPHLNILINKFHKFLIIRIILNNFNYNKFMRNNCTQTHRL